MTMSMAAVCILSGARTAADVAAALPGRFQAEHGAAAWDVPSVAGGRLFWRPSAVGLDVLLLRFSGTTYYSDAASIEAALAELLSCGDALGLVFAYVTRYEFEFDEQWVEENVLLPLLMGQPERIPLESFERVLIPPRPVA